MFTSSNAMSVHYFWLSLFFNPTNIPFLTFMAIEHFASLYGRNETWPSKSLATWKSCIYRHWSPDSVPLRTVHQIPLVSGSYWLTGSVFHMLSSAVRSVHYWKLALNFNPLGLHFLGFYIQCFCILPHSRSSIIQSRYASLRRFFG